MDIHEEPKISKTEKVTRFGCGALLGLVFGFYIVMKYSLEWFGIAVAVIIATIGICGYFALKYGDEFWYAIFGRGR